MCEVVRSKLSEFSVVEVGSRRQDREGDSQVHTGEGGGLPIGRNGRPRTLLHGTEGYREAR